mmetsp:Transcript_22015/g.62726  ORF Transcript_22015/g.62726 Transcript_22015/m.62726 type:complete len:138 (-) Transcript_22015:511-924(-)
MHRHQVSRSLGQHDHWLFKAAKCVTIELPHGGKREIDIKMKQPASSCSVVEELRPSRWTDTCSVHRVPAPTGLAERQLRMHQACIRRSSTARSGAEMDAHHYGKAVSWTEEWMDGWSRERSATHGRTAWLAEAGPVG